MEKKESLLKRKLRIVIGILVYLAVFYFLFLVGLSDKVIWLLLIGSVGISMCLYSLMFLFLKTIQYDNRRIYIGQTEISVTDVMMIKEKKLDFILKYFWSPQKTQVSKSKYWDTYIIQYMSATSVKKAIVVVAPYNYKNFYELISHIRVANPSAEIDSKIV